MHGFTGLLSLLRQIFLDYEKELFISWMVKIAFQYDAANDLGFKDELSSSFFMRGLTKFFVYFVVCLSQIICVTETKKSPRLTERISICSLGKSYSPTTSNLNTGLTPLCKFASASNVPTSLIGSSLIFNDLRSMSNPAAFNASDN